MAREDPILGVRVQKDKKERLAKIAEERNESQQAMIEAVIDNTFFAVDVLRVSENELAMAVTSANEALLRGTSPIDAIVSCAPDRVDMSRFIRVVLNNVDYQAILNHLAKSGAKHRTKPVSKDCF